MLKKVSNYQVLWDRNILEKYNCSGPRYTSYPTALEFHEDFTLTDYSIACAKYPQYPLSIYIHIPFCKKLCYYCGCNKIITRQSSKAVPYLNILETEIRERSLLLKKRKVTQLHFGGGTPTFLSSQQISWLMTILRENFKFEKTTEISIELDPREIELHLLNHLHNEGFNRLSIGVQDFNKEVQKLINREQNNTFIIKLVKYAKKLGFRSINLDLIYGLPKQTRKSFSNTLSQVLNIKPNRLSIFNYAHIPELFASQCKIKNNDLPLIDEKISILQDTIFTLTKEHYQFIGMDHFAQSNDELAIAQRNGTLHRSFQGYTTQSNNCEIIGFGMSAISMIGNTYMQNQKELDKYYIQVKHVNHALWRGIVLNEDDLLRGEIIKQLICNLTLNKLLIESKFKITFHKYLKKELELLKPFINDGLVEIDYEKIQVTERGRLLIRNICMCFDKYLQNKTRKKQFSRVI
ncbi:oxygen-independent coproporphyrinogen III oxidase [Candidatus Photodesmus anomalopis]|uniref:Coproporphyrinogen-III oxidase n=1 Tax=Candidatus Photodesmus katoptron Akat1 TaxID=1236703 RepID=S3DLI1_9GAMM|nr:oxygen-independent coproporphyrinogen III oxidase [Candidatus Photodesmus katoptron]EPE38024.1 oxygen-independent coproporphyrinogen III oxidase [Candidatus Photodesmus katoptron Akat1]